MDTNFPKDFSDALSCVPLDSLDCVPVDGSVVCSNKHPKLFKAGMLFIPPHCETDFEITSICVAGKEILKARPVPAALFGFYQNYFNEKHGIEFPAVVIGSEISVGAKNTSKEPKRFSALFVGMSLS